MGRDADEARRTLRVAGEACGIVRSPDDACGMVQADGETCGTVQSVDDICGVIQAADVTCGMAQAAGEVHGALRVDGEARGTGRVTDDACGISRAVGEACRTERTAGEARRTDQVANEACQTQRAADETYMRWAIALAKTAAGWTNPNPLVGAVIVKDGRVIGEGCHERYGEFHAERNALAHCSESPEGATIYVTLEPCSHFGKQPPCADALVEAGVARVVVGSRDPNPLVSGRGNARLREAGITVEEDFLREECDALNDIFFHYITTKTPYVVAKWAMSADGKIATHTGDARWVSGEASRAQVHDLRHRLAAIMVGINTVLADDPMLTARRSAPSNQPMRVVCDSHLRIPLDCQLVKTAKEYGLIVACVDGALGKNVGDEMGERIGSSKGADTADDVTSEAIDGASGKVADGVMGEASDVMPGEASDDAMDVVVSDTTDKHTGGLMGAEAARNMTSEAANDVLSQAIDDETIAAVDKVQALREAGVEVLSIPAAEGDGKVDLRKLMAALGELGIDSLLLEGGAALNWCAFQEGIVSEAQVYLAPKLVGGAAAPGPLGGTGVSTMAQAFALGEPSVERVGEDIKLTFKVNRSTRSTVCSQA